MDGAMHYVANDFTKRITLMSHIASFDIIHKCYIISVVCVYNQLQTKNNRCNYFGARSTAA